MGTAGDQVIACALRRGARQHGGFNVDEAVRVHELAQDLDHVMPEFQVRLHGRTPEIDIAVAKLDVVMDVFVVELERRGVCVVQDFDAVTQYLDFTGRQIRVDGALGTVPDTAGDPDHVFIADRIGDGKGLGPVGIEHNLGQSLAVAQINKDHAAMIATAVDPAAQADLLVDHGRIDVPAVMTTHIRYLSRLAP